MEFCRLKKVLTTKELITIFRLPHSDFRIHLSVFWLLFSGMWGRDATFSRLTAIKKSIAALRTKGSYRFQIFSMMERSDFHKYSIFNIQSSMLLMVARLKTHPRYLGASPSQTRWSANSTALIPHPDLKLRPRWGSLIMQFCRHQPDQTLYSIPTTACLNIAAPPADDRSEPSSPPTPINADRIL